jgi:hypothetical protein
MEDPVPCKVGVCNMWERERSKSVRTFGEIHARIIESRFVSLVMSHDDSHAALAVHIVSLSCCHERWAACAQETIIKINIASIVASLSSSLAQCAPGISATTVLYSLGAIGVFTFTTTKAIISSLNITHTSSPLVKHYWKRRLYGYNLHYF